MLLEVAYAYRDEVVRGKRIKSEFVFHSEVERVEIREAPPEDAPVSVSYVREPRAGEGGGTVAFRWFDGGFYGPYPNLSSNELDLCVRALGADPRLLFPQETRLRHPPTIPLAEDKGVRVTRSSGREVARAEVHRAASEMLAVDGKLWRLTGEPVLVVRAGAVEVQSVRRGSDPVRILGAEPMFRLDETEAAVAWVERTTGKPPAAVATVELASPPMLSLNLESFRLFRVAKDLEREMMSYFHSRNPVWFDAIEGLQRVVKRYRAQLAAGEVDREAEDQLLVAVARSLVCHGEEMASSPFKERAEVVESARLIAEYYADKRGAPDDSEVFASGF